MRSFARLLGGVSGRAAGDLQSDQPGDELCPSVAEGAGVHVVAWEHAGDVLGRTIDAADVPGPTIPLSTGSMSSAVDVTSNPMGYFAVWQGHPSTTFDEMEIIGRRLDAAGVPLAVPALISRSNNRQDGPAAAFMNDEYLVVWRDHRSLDSGVPG